MMRKWFITGISSGLGQAMARLVMEMGDYVVGTFRQHTQAAVFNREHKGKGEAVVLDITDANRMADVVEEITKRHGQIDVLVNNAGVGFIGAIEEASLPEVRSVFEANFFGALQLTQILLPGMRSRKQGTIVQISSHGGIKAFAGFGVYNASKFALEGASEAMAQELAPLGIRVLLVEPGPFRTAFAGNGLQEASAAIADYNETAGAFRHMLRDVHGRQEGDPHKAAMAIYDTVTSGTDNLRLPLGKTALKTIQMKLDSVQHDLDAGRKVAEMVVF
ncbi:MAG: oxidoreductase [Cyclobacteriaceae bacterium]